MIKEDIKKSAKLNDFDRHVLLVYSEISLETGTKVTTEATVIKTIHKNLNLKS